MIVIEQPLEQPVTHTAQCQDMFAYGNRFLYSESTKVASLFSLQPSAFSLQVTDPGHPGSLPPWPGLPGKTD